MIAILITIFIPIVGTRSNFHNMLHYDWWWSMTFTFLVLTMVVCQIHLGAMIVRYMTRHGRALSARWVAFGTTNCYLPDLAVVLASITQTFELIGRVRNGQCPEGTSLWESQGCNPVADAHSVPHDSVIVIFLVPILVLTCYKECAIQAAALGSVIGLVGVAVSLWMVGGYLQTYTALYGMIFCLVTFESERTKRVSFLLSRSVRIKQELLHKEQLAAVTSQNKALLAEAEMKQLRALMGNVAHDLKTPIACIAADIALMRDAAESVTAPRGASSNSLSERSQSNRVFLTVANSIEATANFMLMAINRSQDFVKSTLNVALTPTISAFSIQDAATFACACVNNTQSGREIILHPLPRGICTYLMSDRQWFIENIMCLVDNATKYSPVDSRVEVVVKLIPRRATRTADWTNSDRISLTANCSLSLDSDDDVEDAKVAIEEEVEAKAADVVVFVKDMGVGVAPDMKDHLFMPYQVRLPLLLLLPLSPPCAAPFHTA